MTTTRLDPQARPGAAALRGRVILITGAGSGIGRAWALAAARLGATVVLLDKSVAELEAVYDAIEADGGPQPAIYPMDLLGAGPEDHATLATRLQDSLGGLHGLVHNAAVLGKPAPLTQYDIRTWYETLQVNLNAPFLLTRYCLPLLQAADDGRLIGVSDASGRDGEPFQGAYGASKWGLEGLLRTLVAELPAATGLRVASIDPGPVHTALRRAGYPAEDGADLPDPEVIGDRLSVLLDPGFDLAQGGCYTL